jgi:hypothetical protein
MARRTAPPGSSFCEEWVERGGHMQNRFPGAALVLRHLVRLRLLRRAIEGQTRSPARVAKLELWGNA